MLIMHLDPQTLLANKISRTPNKISRLTCIAYIRSQLYSFLRGI